MNRNVNIRNKGRELQPLEMQDRVQKLNNELILFVKS